MKQNTQNPSHAVFVAFHINEDVKASGESARILSLVSELFGSQSEKAVELATMDSREIVVKVRRPVMDSKQDETAFFEKLSELFVVTSSHSPHFTHVSH
jgi:hypothetical protein